MSWERVLEMHALGWGGPGNQQTLPGWPKTQLGQDRRPSLSLPVCTLDTAGPSRWR